MSHRNLAVAALCIAVCTAMGQGSCLAQWMRVVVGPEQPNPVFVHITADQYCAPWFRKAVISRDGIELDKTTPSGWVGSYLEPGEASPWCDISGLIRSTDGALLHIHAAEVRVSLRAIGVASLTVQFAAQPDDKHVLKSVKREGPGAGFIVHVPSKLNQGTLGDLKADYEYQQELAASLEALPEVTFGRAPELFPMLVGMSMSPTLFSPALRQAEYDTVRRMGFNGSNDDDLQFSRATVSSWKFANGCHYQPQTELIEQRIAEQAAAWASRKPPLCVLLMDEPSGATLAHITGCPVCADVFRRWLRDDLAVPLEDLGCSTWEAVAPVSDPSEGALYYYSQRFRPKALADFLRLQTSIVERLWPGAPPTTVTLSDGAVYHASMYGQGTDYWELFGSRALTMAWSTDWSNVAATYELGGYNVDLLRAACAKNGQPIGMNLISSFGRKPLDVKLKASSSIAHGANALHSYFYGPYYTSHEHGWYGNLPMHLATAEICHEVGGAEDLLVGAERVRADVAIVYSRASDIWCFGDTKVYGTERMAAYLALAHSQVPVDFLCEEDVAAGGLDGYRAAYVFGPNMLRSAVGPIAAWVQSGGMLYLSAGAAMRDEYNRPDRTLETMLGVQRGEVVTYQRLSSASLYLTNLKPMGPLGALGIMQEAKAEKRFGKGMVFSSSVLHGLSYLRTALAARDADTADQTLLQASYNPWEYPSTERDTILRPVRYARLRSPVVLNHPLVEGYMLSGSKGAVVPLANYGLQPIASLAVQLRVTRPVARIESVRSGPLKFRAFGDGTINTAVPLQDTDVLKLYWADA